MKKATQQPDTTTETPAKLSAADSVIAEEAPTYDLTDAELGIATYEAYAEAVGGKTHDGKPMPTWEANDVGAPVLTDKVKHGWICAGRRALQFGVTGG